MIRDTFCVAEANILSDSTQISFYRQLCPSVSNRQGNVVLGTRREKRRVCANVKERIKVWCVNRVNSMGSNEKVLVDRRWFELGKGQRSRGGLGNNWRRGERGNSRKTGRRPGHGTHRWVVAMGEMVSLREKSPEKEYLLFMCGTWEEKLRRGP